MPTSAYAALIQSRASQIPGLRQRVTYTQERLGALRALRDTLAESGTVTLHHAGAIGRVEELLDSVDDEKQAAWLRHFMAITNTVSHSFAIKDSIVYTETVIQLGDQQIRGQWESTDMDRVVSERGDGYSTFRWAYRTGAGGWVELCDLVYDDPTLPKPWKEIASLLAWPLSLEDLVYYLECFLFDNTNQSRAPNHPLEPYSDNLEERLFAVLESPWRAVSSPPEAPPVRGVSAPGAASSVSFPDDLAFLSSEPDLRAQLRLLEGFIEELAALHDAATNEVAFHRHRADVEGAFRRWLWGEMSDEDAPALTSTDREALWQLLDKVEILEHAEWDQDDGISGGRTSVAVGSADIKATWSERYFDELRDLDVQLEPLKLYQNLPNPLPVDVLLFAVHLLTRVYSLGSPGLWEVKQHLRYWIMSTPEGGSIRPAFGAQAMPVAPLLEAATVRPSTAHVVDMMGDEPDMVVPDGTTHLKVRGAVALRSLAALGLPTSLQEIEIHAASALVDISALASLPALSRVTIRGAYELVDISALEQSGALRELAVSSARGLELSTIQRLTDLTSLELSFCSPIEKLGFLKKLVRLEGLKLRGAQPLTRLAGFTRLTSLRRLDLSFCRALKNVSGLAKCTALEELNLSHTQVGSTQALQKKLPKLTVIT